MRRLLGPPASRPPPPYPPPPGGEGRVGAGGRDARGPRFAHASAATALAVILAGAPMKPESAQQPLPRIWDLQLPSPVGDLPQEEFVDPACGTNGGPPGLALRRFKRFNRCRPPPPGLPQICFLSHHQSERI